MKIKVLLLSGAMMLNIGCSQWPEQIGGGAAEEHPESLAPIEVGKPITDAHALRFDLTLLQRHLDLMVVRGAELCFPAAVNEASSWQRRLQRELYAGLIGDVAVGVVALRKQQAVLARKHSQALSSGACKLPLLALDQDKPA